MQTYPHICIRHGKKMQYVEQKDETFKEFISICSIK